MVGDKEHDVNGARRVGIPCVGVAYGYGSREELLRAQPLAIVNSVPELAAFLIDGRLERQEAAKPQETGQKDRLDLHRGRPLLKVWRVLYPVGIHFAASIVASLIVIIPMTVYALMEKVPGADAVSTIGLTGLMEILAIPFLLYFMKKDRILRENLGAEGIKTKASPVLVLILLFAAAALSDLLSQGMSVLRIPDLFPYYGEMTDEMYAQSRLYSDSGSRGSAGTCRRGDGISGTGVCQTERLSGRQMGDPAVGFYLRDLSRQYGSVHFCFLPWVLVCLAVSKIRQSADSNSGSRCGERMVLYINLYSIRLRLLDLVSTFDCC